jgi:hypothetical protein
MRRYDCLLKLKAVSDQKDMKLSFDPHTRDEKKSTLDFLLFSRFNEVEGSTSL